VSVASHEGVVASGTGGVWRVLADDGTEHEAVMRGRLKKSDAGRRPDGSMRRDTVASAAGKLKLAVGDRVRLERDAEQTGPERACAARVIGRELDEGEL